MAECRWAHWHHLANTTELVLSWLNLWFLRPTWVHNPKGKSIGSAIFAQLMAKCRQAHWRHLANMTEVVLRWAHPNPQPKLQIDQFSHFCTAYSRKVSIFYNRFPFCQSCPFQWGDLDPHLTQFLGPIQAHNPNGMSIGLAFAQITVQCPYTLQWDAPSPKIASSYQGIWTI